MHDGDPVRTDIYLIRNVFKGVYTSYTIFFRIILELFYNTGLCCGCGENKPQNVTALH